jgi:hypothetical protein
MLLEIAAKNSPVSSGDKFKPGRKWDAPRTYAPTDRIEQNAVLEKLDAITAMTKIMREEQSWERGRRA